MARVDCDCGETHPGALAVTIHNAIDDDVKDKVCRFESGIFHQTLSTSSSLFLPFKTPNLLGGSQASSTDSQHQIPNVPPKWCCQVLNKTNQWVASVYMNGNHVFLGSFPTELQAWVANRKWTGETDVDMPKMTIDLDTKQTWRLSLWKRLLTCMYKNQFNPETHKAERGDKVSKCLLT